MPILPSWQPNLRPSHLSSLHHQRSIGTAWYPTKRYSTCLSIFETYVNAQILKAKLTWCQFEVIPDVQLPPGVKFGVKFTAMTINAPKHIEFLYKTLARAGVRFLRRKLLCLEAAYIDPSTNVVFNCTGIAAKTLVGVEDDKVFPTRGQVVLVRAPKVKNIMMLHGSEHETYIIPRPSSNGNVILGGYMQKGNE